MTLFDGLSPRCSRTQALLRTGIGIFASACMAIPSSAASPLGAAAAPAVSNDFTGDGLSDLLWRNGTYGLLNLTPVKGGTIVADLAISTGLSSDCLLVGSADFDGDGKADLVWWNQTTGEVTLMLMNGNNVKSQAIIYTEPNTAWRIQAVANFGGPGKPAIVWRNGWTGEIYMMPVVAGVVQPGSMIYLENRSEWQIVGSGDFDGDGMADLLWWNRATGDVFQMLMNGSTIKSQAIIYTEPDTRWMITGIGDFDGDGKADLVWRHQGSGNVYMTLLNGAAIKANAAIYVEPDTTWQIVSVGDFDGDGKADLLWWNSASGQTYQMLMNGLTIKQQGFYGSWSTSMAPATPGNRPLIGSFNALPSNLVPVLGPPVSIQPGPADPITPDNPFPIATQTTQLFAYFVGGTGVINPGNIPVVSGQPVTVTLSTPLFTKIGNLVQEYTLTVTAGGGATDTYRTTVTYNPYNFGSIPPQ